MDLAVEDSKMKVGRAVELLIFFVQPFFVDYLADAFIPTPLIRASPVFAFAFRAGYEF